MSKFVDINLGKNNGLLDLLYIQYNSWTKINEFIKKTKFIKVNNSNLGIPTFLHTDILNINSINNSVVFINCLTEGIHDYDSFFNHYNKNNFYIIFSNSVWDKNCYNIDIDYVNLPYYLFLNNTIISAVNPYIENYGFVKEYSFDYPKENMFVATTGSYKPERNFIVETLTDNLDFKNFILKYRGKNYGKNYDYLDPYHQDVNNFHSYKPYDCFDFLNISQSIPTDLYNSSYFNLVIETDVDYPHSFFPTEKISKALLTGIPFVVYSTPNFLKNLRSIGFTTYNEIWDESYDLEFNFQRRATMIVDLCNQLNCFNWAQHRDKLLEISYKNASNLLRNNRTFLNQFENIRKVLDIVYDHDIVYIKNNQQQLFKCLENNTV
jgi:hypothetical protein